ncbi:probable 2-oxoglutarate dehydrogenase E1 component DHKTD1, mitochondrial, partial [Paramuricea clavata]
RSFKVSMVLPQQPFGDDLLRTNSLIFHQLKDALEQAIRNLYADNSHFMDVQVIEFRAINKGLVSRSNIPTTKMNKGYGELVTVIIIKLNFNQVMKGHLVLLSRQLDSGVLGSVVVRRTLFAARTDKDSCKSSCKKPNICFPSCTVVCCLPDDARQIVQRNAAGIVRNFRKPLIVASPKLLLRSPVAVSKLSEMAPGTHFHPILGDNHVDPSQVKRVVFCSGKYYYTLAKERENRNIQDTAIIRLEALTPFPAEDIKKEVQKYSNASEFIWCQEEHRNMGAWTFVNPRFDNLIGVKLRYVGRKILATPAVGMGKVHEQESAEILNSVF